MPWVCDVPPTILYHRVSKSKERGIQEDVLGEDARAGERSLFPGEPPNGCKEAAHKEEEDSLLCTPSYCGSPLPSSDAPISSHKTRSLPHPACAFLSPIFPWLGLWVPQVT